MKAIVAGTSHSSSQMQTTLPQLARQVKLSLVLRPVGDEAIMWYIISSISSWLSKNGNILNFEINQSGHRSQVFLFCFFGDFDWSV